MSDDAKVDEAAQDGPGPEDGETPEERERQVLLSINRLGRELRDMAKVRAEVETLYNAERAQLDEWRDDRLAGMDDRQAEIERQVENAVRAGVAECGRKVWQTATVRAALKAPTRSVEITDPRALEEWVVQWAVREKRLDLLTVAALKSVAKDISNGTDPVAGRLTAKLYALVVDGERIPGAVLVEPHADSFSCKPVR